MKKIKHVGLLLLVLPLLQTACTSTNHDDAEVKRLEADVLALQDEKSKLEAKLKEAGNPEQHLQSEQEMELLKSRLERLNEKLKTLHD